MNVALWIVQGAGALGVATFFGLYLGRSNWREYTLGKLILGFFAVVLIMFALVLTKNVFGDYPGRDTVRFAAYAILAGVFWSMVVGLLHIQSKEKHGED